MQTNKPLALVVFFAIRTAGVLDRNTTKSSGLPAMTSVASYGGKGDSVNLPPAGRTRGAE